MRCSPPATLSPPATRVSVEMLSSEIKALAKKIESVEKKAKKAPADLKDQLKAFLAVRAGGIVAWLPRQVPHG